MQLDPPTQPLTPENLRERILGCEACTARKECSRPTPWWPRTDPSNVMMIGRNPGINEDREGVPFVGRGGQVFQAWLNGIGVTRDQIWLTNTLKCFTQADRKPKSREVTICWNTHLRWELAYCKPQLIVALGAEAFEVTTAKDRLTLRHGILYDRLSTLNAYVMGVIHPGSAMRSSDYMDMMIEDARLLKPLLPVAFAGRLREEGPPDGYEPQD